MILFANWWNVKFPYVRNEIYHHLSGMATGVRTHLWLDAVGGCWKLCSHMTSNTNKRKLSLLYLRIVTGYRHIRHPFRLYWHIFHSIFSSSSFSLNFFLSCLLFNCDILREFNHEHSHNARKLHFMFSCHHDTGTQHIHLETFMCYSFQY